MSVNILALKGSS